MHQELTPPSSFLLTKKILSTGSPEKCDWKTHPKVYLNEKNAVIHIMLFVDFLSFIRLFFQWQENSKQQRDLFLPLV